MWLINREMWGKNGVKLIIDNDETLWLNEKHIKEGLDHDSLWMTTVKYHLGHRKHRY